MSVPPEGGPDRRHLSCQVRGIEEADEDDGEPAEVGGWQLAIGIFYLRKASRDVTTNTMSLVKKMRHPPLRRQERPRRLRSRW